MKKEDKRKKTSAKNIKPLNTERVTIAKIRQLGVLEKVGKGESISSAAPKLGYSKSYARSGRLTKTRAWNEILATVYNDETLAEVHADLLHGMRVKTFEFPVKEKPEDCAALCRAAGFTVYKSGFAFGRPFVQCFIPDREYRARGLEMAFKLKKYFTENLDLNVNKYKSMSDSELAEAITAATKFFKKG